MIEYLKAWLALKADRRGVTAMEYALIGSLIAVAIIAASSLQRRRIIRTPHAST